MLASLLAPSHHPSYAVVGPGNFSSSSALSACKSHGWSLAHISSSADLERAASVLEAAGYPDAWIASFDIVSPLLSARRKKNRVYLIKNGHPFGVASTVREIPALKGTKMKKAAVCLIPQPSKAMRTSVRLALSEGKKKSIAPIKTGREKTIAKLDKSILESLKIVEVILGDNKLHKLVEKSLKDAKRKREQEKLAKLNAAKAQAKEKKKERISKRNGEKTRPKRKDKKKETEYFGADKKEKKRGKEDNCVNVKPTKTVSRGHGRHHLQAAH